nr:MAG TPA: hypothetical protein [Caudoviricetes sp.]
MIIKFEKSTISILETTQKQTCREPRKSELESVSKGYVTLDERLPVFSQNSHT